MVAKSLGERRVVHIVWYENGEGASVTSESWEDDQRTAAFVEDATDESHLDLFAAALLCWHRAMPSLFGPSEDEQRRSQRS